MNYANNIYKRYITQLIIKNPKKTIPISRTTHNILLDKMFVNGNNKFSIKNKNKKNILVSQPSHGIIKNLSIESLGESKKIKLNKTIEIKNMKINADKKFPRITRYYKNWNNFNNNNNNIQKLYNKSIRAKKEKSIENAAKTPMYYYRLLQMYKLKEILDNKKKQNEEYLKQLIVKNSVKKENKLNKNVNKIKIINIRVKNQEKESEEDIDKVEHNFYNLIKKENDKNNEINNFCDDNKLGEKNGKNMNVNNSLNRKFLTQREKNKLENSKILNYKNIFFHNQILNNNLKL